ncbi:gastrin/cholecystokinin type B receptor-like [Asterias rubens]|uniref:gastrin/cholecystokinin type B receptor-like n=1 Tax=Asterias rubens TaxID=7604 RepID=UPI0014559038|nr:gastrin/cholecystokinin type B receptor-like [Asterias rubens]
MEDMSSAFNSTQFLNDTKLEPAFVQLGVIIFRISCYTLILLLGVPGNSLILRVYWTKTLKTSTHVFIMTLAWADLAVCLIKLVNIVWQGLLMMGHEIPVVIRLFGAFDATAIGTSIMITAVIAIDRYDCVCRPHRRFFTHRRGKIAAWASFMLSVLINSPEYVELFSNSPILPIIRTACHAIICATVLVVVAVFYSLVYKSIRQHVKVGASSFRTRRNDCSTIFPPYVVVQGSSSIKDGSQPSTSKVRKEALDSMEKPFKIKTSAKIQQSAKQAFATDLHTPTSLDTGSGLEANSQRTRPEQPTNVSQLQRQTTKMLLLASVIFSITWLPYWIFIIVSFAVQGGLNINPILLQVVNETFLMLYINHVVNPFIYGVANRRFRKDCREVIRKFKLC